MRFMFGATTHVFQALTLCTELPLPIFHFAFNFLPRFVPRIRFRPLSVDCRCRERRPRRVCWSVAMVPSPTADLRLPRPARRFAPPQSIGAVE